MKYNSPRIVVSGPQARLGYARSAGKLLASGLTCDRRFNRGGRSPVAQISHAQSLGADTCKVLHVGVK